MPKKPKPEPDDKEQSQRFVETAQELEIDENKKAFERALSAIVTSKATSESRKPSD